MQIFFGFNSLLGMKYQNRFDEANCIDINFHSLLYMSFFDMRLRLKGGCYSFWGVNFLYFTFVCTSIRSFIIAS